MKSIALFFTLLLFIVCIRVYWGGILTGGTDELANMTRLLSVRETVDNVPFPEDVLPFSPAEWQQRFGCGGESQRYIGYTAQSQLSLAVIQDGQHERLYELGDALGGEEQQRIIALDEQRIVLRSPKGIRVMCRNGVTTEALPTPTSTATVAIPVTGKIYASPMGEVAQVMDPQGKVTGYRLQQCQRYCWLLKSLSLQTGDVITVVQGTPVTNLTFTQIKDQIMTQQQDIQLTVERAGQMQQITLPWRNIQPLTRFMPGASHHE
ncbi:hypothetical protein GE278_23585 (plasmid) [Enterobacteriaceae bacterium Kacie_13]|nr:hypothetical protein GE278_23585 [Enterobacteriaceae bacterium Kacie_13]